VTAGLAGNNGSLSLGNNLKSHLRADYLYTGISFGPKALVMIMGEVVEGFYCDTCLLSVVEDECMTHTFSTCLSLE